jgi:cytochrome oxidase Cu insertion factor (SCO1/SenC/PrrC family)
VDENRKSLLLMIGSALAAVLIIGLMGITLARLRSASPSSASTPTILQQELGAGVDPGTPLHGKPAPDFTLTDQFGHQVSLHQFRGKVVVLAFTDSECTTICPLTSTILLDALRLLPASSVPDVQLLGLNANPDATSIDVVRNYSIAHGLENRWLFLTGSKEQLAKVWQDYHIYVQIVQGNIDHTPALYVIDRNGGEQTVFLTSGQYGVISDEVHVLASAIAPLLPGHVQVQLEFTPPQTLSPAKPIALPRATAQGTSGTVTLGPGKPLLTFFFASWSPDIQQQLAQLNAVAQATGAPQVVAVDIGETEPSATALPTMLGGIQQPLAYPVAIDQNGGVADAYHVEDVPWFTLTSAQGTILGSVDGWQPPDALQQWMQKQLQQGQP